MTGARPKDDANAPCAAQGDGRRLPTMRELMAAAGGGDEARLFEEDGWFWSQTPGENDERAWAVMSDGATNANRKTTRARVRCVR